MKPSYFSLFVKDLPGTLGVHKEYTKQIRDQLSSPSLSTSTREIISAQEEELRANLNAIENSHKRFISTLVGHSMQSEIEKQAFEIFPDSSPNSSKIAFIRMKIIYEWISSFWRISDNAWNNLFSSLKVLSTYNETMGIYEIIYNNILKDIFELNIDTKTLLSRIEKNYNCKIVGSSSYDKQVMMSNLIFEDDKNYEYSSLFPANEAVGTRSSSALSDFKSSSKLEEEYFFTIVKGTKEWNRNDAYILNILSKDLKIEQQKFYSSSFVILNPAENSNINLAAALVRKNSGYSAATKYNKMVITLIEFAITNLLSKDFGDLSDDPNTFLYHIGPVVLWYIIQEDMLRRDFGYCYLVDSKNSLSKFLPEIIIKKHIIDFWSEKFYDLKTSQVDSYITYSKGISNIKESYKLLFDQAAATRKKASSDSTTLEKYLLENTGKFFGYRRAQVYRRFMTDTIWGQLQESNSSDLINKFNRKS